MGFGVGFLQQWEPSFVFIAALGKVQGSGACLVGFAVLFCAVGTVDVVPDNSFVLSFIVVWRTEVQLVVNNGVLPFTIYANTDLPLAR